MSIIWAIAFILFLVLVLGLNVFSLPANWILLGLAWVWALIHPGEHYGIAYYMTLAALALIGEVVEYGAQMYGVKKYGGTNKGNIGALLGAIGGAIVGAPFLLGFGAIIGAVAGAYLGCYAFERMHGRPSGEAWRAAKGAMWGRMLGMVVKTGLGGVMVTIIAGAVWPAPREIETILRAANTPGLWS